MDTKSEKQDNRPIEGPGAMPSYNNRPDNREGEVENVVEKKDESQSYTDYNGNSEANAPARARE